MAVKHRPVVCKSRVAWAYLPLGLVAQAGERLQRFTVFQGNSSGRAESSALHALLPVQIPGFRKLLEAYRASGRKLFVATNSLWDYTNVVMNYLLLGKTGSGIDLEWLRLFDVVMTGGVYKAAPASARLL